MNEKEVDMFSGIGRAVLAWVAAVGLVAAGAATAAETGLHQQVGGLDIYYGILPDQVAGRHEPTHEEQAMHGWVPARKDEYHLVVAIEEKGKRITDADVTASVEGLGLAGTRRKLEPMHIGGLMSFGNYFVLRGAGLYRIVIEVRRAGRPPVI